MDDTGCQGSRALVVQVRAALVGRGTSLTRWCREHGINRSWTYEALMGRRNGARAKALRNRLMIEAGIRREND